MQVILSRWLLLWVEHRTLETQFVPPLLPCFMIGLDCSSHSITLFPTCIISTRILRPLPVDGAQGSNCSKTNTMRGSPNDREKRTVPLDETDSLIQIYHTIFSRQLREHCVPRDCLAAGV